MAFMEGKLQMIDLIGALGAKRQQEDTAEKRKQMELQNQMMMEEMKQQQWRNQMEKAPDTMTVKGVGYDPRFGFGTEKKFLNDMPGMITGVSPETVFKNMGETDRAMISAMRGGSGGGQAPGMAELLGAQTNLADEQARQAQYQRQGRGTATRDLLNQGNLDTTVKGQENQLNIANTYADARNVAAQGKAEAGADIQTDRVIEAGYPTQEKYLKSLPAFDDLGQQGKAEILLIAKDVYKQARAAGKFPRWEDLIADIKAKY